MTLVFAKHPLAKLEGLLMIWAKKSRKEASQNPSEPTQALRGSKWCKKTPSLYAQTLNYCP